MTKLKNDGQRIIMKKNNNKKKKEKKKIIPIHQQQQQFQPPNTTNTNTKTTKFHTYFTFFLVLYIFITSNLNNRNNATAAMNKKELLSFNDNENDNNNNNLSDTITTTTTTTSSRAKRLGDGCYHVFIDVGANVGVHGRFLFEPEKYPKSKSSVQLFRDEYGLDSTRNNIDYCVFEIEANPKHWKRLDIISNAYKEHNKGWKYHIVKAAASDKEGNMTFYHQGTNDNRNNEWGFSNVHDYKKINDTNAYIETVPSIKLSDWIQYHILERIVPELPPSVSLSLSLLLNDTTTTINNKNMNMNNTISSKPKPVLGMKMDIEGSEYVVLPDLIHSNTICNFDFIFGEYHTRFAPIDPSVGHRVSLTTRKELEMYERSITQVIESSRNCNVRWISSDDESYLRDGIPLPN